ncbi:2-aminoethylphosphonate--pyruvate transaminase-like [Macrobrachium nipponense]|uniref:2-aminoethylphosphonate--pyruvate transaminase-like n=1 Tax=Macrobrachium nipponense TaxID=159736 RepID=UPI0030C854AC
MASYKEKKLFTPGPLCCSRSVKEAMLHDVGSRDVNFVNCVRYIRKTLLEVAQVSAEEFTAVPLQGSGTYSVEAVINTTSPRQGAKVLILSNGAYGRRMNSICSWAGIEAIFQEFPEDKKIDLSAVESLVKGSVQYTTICVVHSETSSGVVNPIREIGQLVRQFQPNAAYVVDAMSSFGAVPIDMKTCHIDYLVSSANKCLEGVPGFAYAICRTQHLLSCKGNCRVYSLDLVDQYLNLEATGQFRFTPPTHTMLAFQRALEEYQKSGGLEGRAGRYRTNRRILKEGMKDLGFKELLDDSHEGYIITSYFFPKHPKFCFSTFYSKLSELDQVIYPGKVTKADCFRIGNIGYLFPEDMEHLLKCVRQVLGDMGLQVPLDA